MNQGQTEKHNPTPGVEFSITLIEKTSTTKAFSVAGKHEGEAIDGTLTLRFDDAGEFDGTAWEGQEPSDEGYQALLDCLDGEEQGNDD